jgi:Ras-related protein Rab-22
MSKLVMVEDKPIKFQIWDTAGQEKYHSLAPMYYRNAAAAILVYDVTKASTFKTLQNWVFELEQRGPKDIALAIVGNKSDLGDMREVEQSTAEQYARDIGGIFKETSAKNNEGIDEVFGMITGILPPAPSRDETTTSLRQSQVVGNRESQNKDKCGC